ncbi:hypothetical protein GCM10022416_20550 [Actinomadura keratinilytica]|uniref:Uncharacterized protein n=1 Tax=Actinomadura keratinilytica TaxID=547461 RepID=A0ABP7YJK3_9ACTN
MGDELVMGVGGHDQQSCRPHPINANIPARYRAGIAAKQPPKGRFRSRSAAGGHAAADGGHERVSSVTWDLLVGAARPADDHDRTAFSGRHPDSRGSCICERCAAA